MLARFCGCATFIVAVKELERRWIGIDRRVDARYHTDETMTKIIMSEAEKLVPVARSTFRKHAKAGKFSVGKNQHGLQAELQRYYGNRNGTETPAVEQSG